MANDYSCFCDYSLYCVFQKQIISSNYQSKYTGLLEQYPENLSAQNLLYDTKYSFFNYREIQLIATSFKSYGKLQHETFLKEDYQNS